MISIRNIRRMSPMTTLITFLLGALYSIAPVMASIYGRLGFQKDHINQTVYLAENISYFPPFARIFLPIRLINFQHIHLAQPGDRFA